jgi:hypothetical protein
MLTIILFYLSVSIISGSIMVHFIKSAPTGWEDEYGFHEGVEEKTEIKTQKFQKVI